MRLKISKLFLICATWTMLAGTALALDSWLPLDQMTVAWDAVATLSDGTAITPELGNLQYDLVYAPEDKSNPRPLWTGDQTQATVTIPENGSWILGIRSKLMVNGTAVSQSEYGWTDDPEVASVNGTFGILRYSAPSMVTGVTKVTP